MFQEAAQAPSVVQAQLDRNRAVVSRIAGRLRQIRPRFVITVARGSSDHAACFAKYLVETKTGLFTVSAGPSIASVYKRTMDFRDSVCLLISQSGASPDLLAMAEAARKGGSLVIAMVNVADSPLAGLADEVLELHAGAETSVAATKSFIASLAAIVQLVAAWKGDGELEAAIEEAPAGLQSSWELDWSDALAPMSSSRDLYVLGRGVGLGVAYEAALKLKEVCGVHAEGFSSAEVLHGPVTIAQPDFPVLVLAQDDQAMPGISQLVDDLAGREVRLITAGVQHPAALNLPFVSAHPAVEPILRIQSFYRLANALSVRLGLDPDSPPHLKKVTATY